MSETLGILLIEGRGGLARALLSSRADLHVTHVDRMAKAIALSAPARAAGSISAVLVDLTLPDCQGLEAFRRAATLLPGTPIVALLHGHDEDLARSVMSEGAQACLEHDGLDGGALAQALRQAVLRKQAEARRFRALCDSAPMGILLAAGRRVLMANSAAQEMLGFSETEFSGISVVNLFPAAARPILEAALDAGAVAIPESRFTADMTRKDETSLRCRVHVSGATFNDAPAVALWLDVTGADESAAAPTSRDPVRQARKMEALGRLAGGVAHDFNNLLTAINGYSEHLLSLPSVDGPIASGLKAIKRAGESAAAMTRGLMSFSRSEGGEARPVAVDAAVREMAPMLQRLLGGIDFRVRAGAGDAAVDLEPGQLEQLILNLCVNARDAMPKGGVLTLSTVNAQVGADDVFTHLAPPAGPHVEIIVEDTGTGMGPETLESLFEPFYTTKHGGRGTGLGLATVYSIVSQAGGGIGVSSEPGAGSRFRIALARSQQPAAWEEKPAMAPAAAQGGGSGGTVLVVEDEPSLREMILTILGRYGFNLLEAASAGEAVDIVAASPAGVDLVVTDVMLRGEEGGHELAGTLQALKPGLRTLFISGHSLDSLADRGIILPADAFLEKPFSPSQLASQVRALMSAARKDG